MVQTELHRHLDVSLRLSTLLELAQTRGLEAQSTSLEAFQKKIVLTKPLSDLNAVLATFQLFPKVLDRPEVLERVAFEAAEDCWNEGTRKIEFRFSPSFVTDASGLSWDDVLTGFERGLERARKAYPELKAGLICIASRDFGIEAVDRTVEFYLKHQARFIGLDLAGAEVNYPCRLFEASFKRVRDEGAAGAKITVHAGEATGPDNMWQAIECLGAQRIGHGIACVQDTQLMEYLAKHRICLEMCPTSNWLTRAVPSLAQHPLPRVLRAGVPVSINTDDPAVFGVTVPHEIQACRTEMGLTEAEVSLAQKHAFEASFLK